ncbi:MAG: FAD binding domain-containing protein [Deltaproteobacteria bacterium]|nr:FAD binding domain-containing protein [Deltaproteobacteria bacterium]
MTAYVRPADLAEATRVLADHPAWMILAGGTDLMVHAQHQPVPVGILDLWRLPGLGGIDARQRDDRSWLRLGAGTTWREVIADARVQHALPNLVAAAREIGALQIQARGTIGGNLGTSSPVGDSLPVWLALGAEIELRSVHGTRTVPYADYCTGYRKTARGVEELITAVWAPVPATGTRLHWRKVGTRKAQSISKVMAAAALALDGDTITAARIGLGAVADRPIRATAIEAALVGRRLGDDAIAAARAALAIAPITDVRSTAAYRHDVAANLIARFVAA